LYFVYDVDINNNKYLIVVSIDYNMHIGTVQQTSQKSV